MYVCSKLLFLKNSGWEVEIFSVDKGEIYIQEFDPYRKQIVPKLGIPTYLTLKKNRKRLVRLLFDNIDAERYQEIVIESHSILFATWGELLAKKISCKHIIYSLIEENQLKDRQLLKFAGFKHNRKELVGITSNYVYRMLYDYREIPLEESYHLSAHSFDIVKDYSHPILSSIPECDYVIGNIGRLGKAYLLPMIDDLICYIKENTQYIYNVVLVGGDPNFKKIQKRIRKKFKRILNANLVMTGYIYPIPRKLITLSDVFISVSGSAGISQRIGVPTISIDVNDFKPIGVVGFTTSNRIYRDQESVIPLNVLLDDILVNKKYKKEISNTVVSSLPDFSSHMKFLLKSEQIKCYYDINTNMSFRTLLKCKIYINRIIGSIIGISRFEKIKERYKAMQNRI